MDTYGGAAVDVTVDGERGVDAGTVHSLALKTEHTPSTRGHEHTASELVADTDVASHSEVLHTENYHQTSFRTVFLMVQNI